MYDRDAILAAVDLRALADELLGPHVGTEAHPMWQCPSPTHAQTGRTPPVSVFTSRWDEERWHCHGCGEGGTAIDLVMQARGVGVRDALEELADRTGIRPLANRPNPDSRRASARLAQRVIDRRVARSRPPALGQAQLKAIEDYVDHCAAELWKPAGRPVRRWLTEKRCLPESVLRVNKVGADLGGPDLPRPAGMPRPRGAAILPVHQHGQAVYLQARVMHPGPNRPKYLNPTADLAPNPKVSVIEPVEVEHDEIIVTEGAIDALSAASAGYRAAAVLSAAYPDRHVALQLARLDGPLVLAMDPDEAGQRAAAQLVEHLAALQRPSTFVHLPSGDLNEILQGGTSLALGSGRAGSFPRTAILARQQP